MIHISHIEKTTKEYESQLNRSTSPAQSVQTKRKGSNFVRKFSTRLLILFGLSAVLTIAICFVVIAVMTAKFFSSSRMFAHDDEMFNQPLSLNFNQSSPDNQSSNLKSDESTNNNSKSERNSFNNWMKYNFGHALFGMNPNYIYKNDHNYQGELEEHIKQCQICLN